jgi:hypothetical protein
MGRQQQGQGQGGQQSRYQRQLKGNSAPSSGNSNGQNDSFKGKGDKATRRFTPIDRQRQREDGDAIDLKFGFHRYIEVWTIY